MSVGRVKIHKYLVMTLDYTVSEIARIIILEYIDEMLTALDKMDPSNSSTNSSAAPEELFNVDEDYENISPDKSKGFHNLVVKTLYTTNRDIPDTCTSVVFLNTRVREPGTNDCKNLAHLMKYLSRTKNLPLILGAGGTGILKWWIGASFVFNPNIKGHADVRLSTERGFPVVTSTK